MLVRSLTVCGGFATHRVFLETAARLFASTGQAPKAAAQRQPPYHGPSLTGRDKNGSLHPVREIFFLLTTERGAQGTLKTSFFTDRTGMYYVLNMFCFY